MSYETNPGLPHIRMEAVRMVEAGHGVRETARHFGYSHSAVLNWCKKAKNMHHNLRTIQTKSSRPHSHPNALPQDIVLSVIGYRMKHRRCAEVIHHLMTKDGYDISVSSVKRILRRCGMTRYSKWKKWHKYTERPLPESPGILVQIDTILDGTPDRRLNVYTMIDVCSRFAYAEIRERANAVQSSIVLTNSLGEFPFMLKTIQSDHGSEFSKHFKKHCVANGLTHRHSRVRRPTDNGHLERFNRTIQEECFSRTTRSFESWKRELPKYLSYYNNERPHMALDMLSPREWLQGID